MNQALKSIIGFAISEYGMVIKYIYLDHIDQFHIEYIPSFHFTIWTGAHFQQKLLDISQFINDQFKNI